MTLPIYTMSQKVPTFKLSVTLSNQNAYTAEKRMKFATKPIRYYPTHLIVNVQ